MRQKIFILIMSMLCLIVSGCTSMKAYSSEQHTLSEGYKKLNDGTTMNEFTPKDNEIIGILVIPKLSAELAIIEAADVDQLPKGISHVKNSYFPTQGGPIILNGNNDPLFNRMNHLGIGDLLVVNLPYGSFTYVIEEARSSDQSIEDMMESKEEGESLTIIVPDRKSGLYILHAKPVKN